jgi:hypothetical protein
MTEIYVGEGSALFVRNNCHKLKSFKSSYKWSFPDPGDFNIFSIVNYENSIIGKKNLSAIIDNFVIESELWAEISSDGLLNFNAQYYYDLDLDAFFIVVVITGVHKKCNYSSYEVDYLASQDASVALRNALKKKSADTKKFHKLLNAKPHLKKLYDKIKAKLGK